MTYTTPLPRRDGPPSVFPFFFFDFFVFSSFCVSVFVSLIVLILLKLEFCNMLLAVYTLCVQPYIQQLAFYPEISGPTAHKVSKQIPNHDILVSGTRAGLHQQCMHVSNTVFSRAIIAL